MKPTAADVVELALRARHLQAEVEDVSKTAAHYLKFVADEIEREAGRLAVEQIKKNAA